MKVENMKALKTQASQYYNNLQDIEQELSISIEPMDYNETRRVIVEDRVLCLYRMESGKIEAFSYEHKAV